MDDNRVDKHRSIIWNYFKKHKNENETFAVYVVGSCKQKLLCSTGTTTCLCSHLQSCHRKNYNECKEKQNEIKDKRKNEEGGTNDSKK